MTPITLPRAVVEQALEALGHVVRQAQENLVPTIHYGPVHDVMNNLRAALAQQAEPVEPVAGVVLNEEGRAALVEHGSEEWHCAARNARRLYTTPPKFVPLTDEEIEFCRQQGYAHAGLSAPFDFGKAARAVERALEEKNRGR